MIRSIFLLFLIALPLILFPQKKEKLLGLAEKAFVNRDYDKSVTLYNEALELSPYEISILYNLGTAQFYAGKYKHAIISLKKSIVLSSDRSFLATAYYNLGLSQIKINDVNEAIVSFKKSILNNPLDIKCRQNLQLALNSLSKTENSDTKPPLQNKDENNQNSLSRPPESTEEKLSKLQKGELKLRDSITNKKSKVGGVEYPDW